MDLAPARLLRGLLIAWLAAVALCAFGVSHAAPVHAASPLVAEDSPAPDDGGDAEPTEEPTDEPSDEPTTERSTEPTVEPTQATAPRSNAEDSSDGSDDHTSSSNSGSDDPSNDTGAVTGAGGGPGDDAANDPEEATVDDSEPANSESSSLGWILLTGGLASAAGAFVIYRRDPAVLAWPWLGHAH